MGKRGMRHKTGLMTHGVKSKLWEWPVHEWLHMLCDVHWAGLKVGTNTQEDVRVMA